MVFSVFLLLVFFFFKILSICFLLPPLPFFFKLHTFMVYITVHLRAYVYKRAERAPSATLFSFAVYVQISAAAQAGSNISSTSLKTRASLFPPIYLKQYAKKPAYSHSKYRSSAHRHSNEFHSPSTKQLLLLYYCLVPA